MVMMTSSCLQVINCNREGKEEGRERGREGGREGMKMQVVGGRWVGGWDNGE